MSRGIRLLAGTLLAAALIAALAVFGLAPSRSTAARKAPMLPREALLGRPVTLEGMLAASGGRPLLVVFWASWCGPCMSEAPALERFARSTRGRGRIVGVDWSDARAGARAFIRRYSWTFPNVRDAEGAVGNAYGLSELPTTFVLDGRGRIRARLVGPQSVASLSRALATLERA
jgi:cytochrome c biogenesis protein CcmG, thiol:disulfide interchange protein DsbE